MAQSITLTASMRSNLASLKSIQNQMNTTQERLSTGKKVNSAIDNASSFYQSRALTNRASDLDALLDSMGQGIQTIQAANEGIEAVTSFIDQLKSVAQSAYAAATGGASGQTITDYQTQYNNILKEIKTLIGDSGYQGINLLNGGTLNVTFDENRQHILTVAGDDVASELTNSTAAATDAFHWNTDGVGDINWHGGDTYSYFKQVKYDATAVTLANQAAMDEWYNSHSGITLYKLDTNRWVKAGTTWESGVDYATKGDIASSSPVSYQTALENDTTGAGGMHIQESDKIYDANGNSIAGYINKSLEGISKGLDYLRSYTSSLGNNYSIIQTRQDFTEALIDVLETGSDNLVLADMNEESANYLALQTRQQLAINSLSLASQSAQSVLKLF